MHVYVNIHLYLSIHVCVFLYVDNLVCTCVKNIHPHMCWIQGCVYMYMCEKGMQYVYVHEKGMCKNSMDMRRCIQPTIYAVYYYLQLVFIIL